MRIHTYIHEAEAKRVADRLSHLKGLNAPTAIIESVEAELEHAKAGTLKIGGDAKLLDGEFTDKEVKKGRGGKVYIEFDNGTRYFPFARYGKFIAAS